MQENNSPFRFRASLWFAFHMWLVVRLTINQPKSQVKVIPLRVQNWTKTYLPKSFQLSCGPIGVFNFNFQSQYRSPLSLFAVKFLDKPETRTRNIHKERSITKETLMKISLEIKVYERQEQQRKTKQRTKTNLTWEVKGHILKRPLVEKVKGQKQNVWRIWCWYLA